MFKRIAGAAAVALTSAALMVGTSVPANAEALDVFAGGGTFNSTAEDGTGAMTSSSYSYSGGGGDPHHPNQVIMDNFGRVAAQTPVQRGATYRITVTFEDARTTESTTGSGATARGFGEVELWNCCFAGEQTFIKEAASELPASTDDATVVMEYTPHQDMTLNVQALLHSYSATSTAQVGTAKVSSSTERTIIDVTKIADAPPSTTPPANPKTCLLFVCL